MPDRPIAIRGDAYALGRLIAVVLREVYRENRAAFQQLAIEEGVDFETVAAAVIVESLDRTCGIQTRTPGLR